eukprot:symbB.v1.2.024731.t1/scaffold2363.1/size81248/4
MGRPFPTSGFGAELPLGAQGPPIGCNDPFWLEKFAFGNIDGPKETPTSSAPMCNDSGKTAEAPKKRLDVEPGWCTLLRSLRAIEDAWHFAKPLGTLGVVLLSAGCGWALLRLLLGNLFLVVIFMGFFCVVISFLAEPEGLLSFLSEEARDFLFNRRIFDFFHDDTPVTNAIRKWGPVQLLLLQDGSSEGAIAHLVQHMDPEVLHVVLCRSFFSFLPPALRMLLLPEDSASGKDDATETGKPSVEWIQDFLRKRNEIKQEKIKYPELFPLVSRTLGLQMAAPFRTRSLTFLRYLRRFALATVGSLLSLRFFHRTWPQLVDYESISEVLQRSLTTPLVSKLHLALSTLGVGSFSIFDRRESPP